MADGSQIGPTQIVIAKNLSYAYSTHDGHETRVLDKCSFEINTGEFLVFQGPSGSGKSTLLYLLGCMNALQDGELEILGVDIKKLDALERAVFRNRFIGFVFQQFHLLPRSTTRDNILLPSHYPIELTNSPTSKSKTDELIKSLGLEGRKTYQPHQLSGAQQQRVAIARALLNDAPLILADEPTGNLDSKNAKIVLDELKRLNGAGKTVVVITHDRQTALMADRILHIHDGRIEKTEVLREVPPRTIELHEKPQELFARAKGLHILRGAMRVMPSASANLFRNRLRSVLTMLGIVIGVAAVMSMVTIGNFAKEKILAGYSELGVNTLHVYGQKNWRQKAVDQYGLPFSSFSWEHDIQPLQSIFPEIIRISPLLRVSNVILSYGGNTIDIDASVNGITADAFIMAGLKVAEGVPLLPVHIDSKSPVCVIGPEINDRLFRTVRPIGEMLSISEDERRYTCKVIGVLSARSTRSQWRKPNLEVFIPYTYFQAVSMAWWASEIHDVLIQLAEKSPVEKIGHSLQGFFERKYGKSGYFRMDSDSILIEQMTKFLGIFSGFLATVACISLLVGGVGITNMMFVSVSERYREIGLRKALGASDISIRWQFLLESVLLCSLAGLIGIASGFAAYELILWLASKFINNLQFAWLMDWHALLFSVISILAVGVGSGIAPALKAEKMSPMEALRSD